MKIVVLDGFGANPGDLSWKVFEKFGDLQVYERTDNKEKTKRIKDADIILTNKVCINDDDMASAPNLKYIGVLATGFNTIDIKAAKEHNIVVTNIPSYSTESVAQMTFAHILNITNSVDYYAKQNRSGRWSNNKDFCYWDSQLHELFGKTIGIVGLGNIGSKVATIAMDFGMSVFAYTSKKASELNKKIQKKTMEELLKESDIISLHCPLSENTREMINKNTLAQMKPNAILINTSRGALVNEQDIADALNSKKLFAYGADVMVNEPPSHDNQLLSCENAFITPHVAWATIEARTRLMNIAVDNIEHFLLGSPTNVVNK